MKTNVQRSPGRGLTLVEVLVLVSVLGVVLLILLSALGRVRPRSARINCANNLKSMGVAFRLFANDHAARNFPMVISTNRGGTREYAAEAWRHFLVMSNELSTARVLVCPADRERRPATSFATLRSANLSYFLGLDASEFAPSTLLMGDRNLTLDGRRAEPGIEVVKPDTILGWTKELHAGMGNVALSDGSVHGKNFRTTRESSAASGRGPGVTNRLAIP